ncbi:MAG: hypothetical protein M3178_14125 [Pseudomonadota bacterium]|nr:hypothetical protein [Pseudomonadota bacterium]
MNQGNEPGDALVVEGGRHDTALVSPKLAVAREQSFLDVPVRDGAPEKWCACRSAECHQNVELFFF